MPSSFEVPCSKNKSALMMRRTLRRWGDQGARNEDVFIGYFWNQKKPEAATTTVKLPLLPFGSGGVGLLTLCHSWPGQDNASRRMLPHQIKDGYGIGNSIKKRGVAIRTFLLHKEVKRIFIILY